MVNVMATQSIKNAIKNDLPGLYLGRILWWSVWLLVVFSGLVLSHWQWQRAAEKQQLLLQQQQADSSVNPHLEPAHLSEVILTGQFLNSHSLWLDNRTLNGQVGVALLTPFVDVAGRLWLIDRGFVNTQGKRGTLDQHLPSQHIPAEQSRLIVIHGIWQALNDTDTGFVLDDKPEGKRIPRIDLVYWPEATYYFSGVLHLQVNSQGLEERQRWWRPYQITPDKHLGYSLQWFLLAAVALVFAIVGRR